MDFILEVIKKGYWVEFRFNDMFGTVAIRVTDINNGITSQQVFPLDMVEGSGVDLMNGAVINCIKNIEGRLKNES